MPRKRSKSTRARAPKCRQAKLRQASDYTLPLGELDRILKREKRVLVRYGGSSIGSGR